MAPRDSDSLLLALDVRFHDHRGPDLRRPVGGSFTVPGCVLHYCVVYDTMCGVEARPFRFSRGSRKHRIGHAGARRVIEAATAETDEVTNAVIVRVGRRR